MKTCFTFLLSLLICLSLQAQTKAKPKLVTKPLNAVAKTSAQTKETKDEPTENYQPVVGEPGKDVIAVYPFTTARGYDYVYAQSVGNAVEAGFVKSNRFTVVERSRFGQIKSEERFEEVNTSQVVKIASKLGAKFIVTGHVTGVSTGETHDTQGKFTGYQTSISVAFKIIDVESGQIKVTESLTPGGQGGSTASSIGYAYADIDGIPRRIIASYFPQRFPFMAIVSKEEKKKETVLTAFKIWGGSDHGLKKGDMVEVYVLSQVMNPTTRKMVTEKQLVGAAQIAEINSGTTSTCAVWKARKYGKTMLDLMSSTPDKVAIEYTGGARPASFWDNF